MTESISAREIAGTDPDAEAEVDPARSKTVLRDWPLLAFAAVVVDRAAAPHVLGPARLVHPGRLGLPLGAHRRERQRPLPRALPALGDAADPGVPLAVDRVRHPHVRAVPGARGGAAPRRGRAVARGDAPRRRQAVAGDDRGGRVRVLRRRRGEHPRRVPDHVRRLARVRPHAPAARRPRRPAHATRLVRPARRASPDCCARASRSRWSRSWGSRCCCGAGCAAGGIALFHTVAARRRVRAVVAVRAHGSERG